MMNNISAVLFDLDGTLIDSAPDLGAAADKMRTDRSLESLPLSLYRPMAGAGARGMIAVAFGLTPQDAAFEALKEEFFSNYEARLVKTTYAFDGVAELIARICDSGLKWGVVTNKSARFTLPLTQAMPLFMTAQTIISGDTTPHAKPHPAPLLEAARQLDLSPNCCVYVGDDERDIVAGRAAGMPTVAAAYGYLGNVSDTKSWNADFTIIKPSELLNLLKMA
ncbi:HAD-IA family hydrolase [Polaromonas sp.]|uniref:HAD family hydrolase n=1 Tax=Polaromonas sp. TaxID=1869339 RepID=UPI0013B62D15|nr:HAD-IA family hydrolase [Polaromonas sp.]NDP63409.1 HAD-IA family hydrolase [Polaromonas sp.]